MFDPATHPARVCARQRLLLQRTQTPKRERTALFHRAALT
jgi:hypothetical protein